MAQALDTLTSLAFALHRGPGQFALLLGSGISRSSGIPTGWGVTLDLVRRLPGAPADADDGALIEWYVREHGGLPSYSALVEGLALGQAERRNLLRGYFEPTVQEREDGVKIPTAAHRAIARLVSLGTVRVIITTNFDRLLEQALRDEGIEPDVVEHETRIAGVTPYAHSRCLILKVHGDYLDTRIRNTEEELAEYPTDLHDYLMRILDDHGLVVCGWSGDFDRALVNAILSSPNRRYGLYWMRVGAPSDAAARIVTDRRGVEIEVESADLAFERLLQRVESLREMDRPRPMDTALLVATAKRLMSRQDGEIQLYDLVHEEVEAAIEVFGGPTFDLNPRGVDQGEPFFKEYRSRVARYEAASERILALASVLTFHGDNRHARLVVRMIELLAQPTELNFGNFWTAMQLYPAFLTIYMAGTAAVAARRLGNAAILLREPQIRVRLERTPKPAPLALVGYEILGDTQPQLLHTDDLNNIPKHYAPIDDHLASLLPGPLTYLHLRATEADDAMASFHFLLQLAFVDQRSTPERIADWAPPGRYYRHGKRSNGWEATPQSLLQAELLAAPSTNPMITAGFFGGDPERMKAVNDALMGFLTRLGEGRY